MTAMVELTPTRRTLIPRMPGRGDLVVVVERDLVLVRGDQVEQLAGIPPWSTGETLIEDHWHVIGGHDFYEYEDAIARCEAAGTDTAAAFLTWVRDAIPALLNDDVLDNAQRLPAFVGSHPVATAARDLSAALKITLGRQGLFAHMHTIGWLDRAGDEWTITNLARRNGWLTWRNVPRSWQSPRSANDAGTYAQVHVTPDGLAQLTETLRAQAHDPPGPPTPPTLFD